MTTASELLPCPACFSGCLYCEGMGEVDPQTYRDLMIAEENQEKADAKYEDEMRRAEARSWWRGTGL